MRRDRGIEANPWRVWPFSIVSLQWLRGERAQRTIEEVIGSASEYPRYFDLLIVDEAHHLAPSGNGKYAVDTQQTKAVMRLSPHAENRLFLTATPHNGHKGSFAALLALLDPQRFTRGAEPNPVALNEVMVRRIKDDITNPDGTPRFKTRRTLPIEVTYADPDRRGHTLLAEYISTRNGEAKSKGAADMVMLLLKKRLFSSPAAFAHTLSVHADTLRRRRVTADVSDTELREQASLFEDDFADEAAKDEAESLDTGPGRAAHAGRDCRAARSLGRATGLGASPRSGN